jgi:hypothetical protein
VHVGCQVILLLLLPIVRYNPFRSTTNASTTYTETSIIPTLRFYAPATSSILILCIPEFPLRFKTTPIPLRYSISQRKTCQVFRVSPYDPRQSPALSAAPLFNFTFKSNDFIRRTSTASTTEISRISLQSSSIINHLSLSCTSHGSSEYAALVRALVTSPLLSSEHADEPAGLCSGGSLQAP